MEQAHNNFVLGAGSGGNFMASEAEIGHKRVVRGMNRAKEAVTIIASNNVHASPTKPTIYVDGREGLAPETSGPQKLTSNAQNRMTCLGENETADRRAFETRVQDIMTMRNTGNVLNARVLETWINETLADAEHLDIPGVVLKPSQKQPIARYNIDRLFLLSQNVEVSMVDRIYRGLFVYSIGFYEMLHKSLQHAKNKYTLLAQVWKVYSILLEYCCRSNYDMLIKEISTEH